MNVQQEIGTRSGEARTQDEHSILNPHLWFRFCLRPGLKFLTVFLLLFSLQAKAESHLMFEKANQLYHNRLYDSAAGLYQQMINDGYCDPALFYNAGNAYYRSNRTGLAIWCFRKAQMLKDDKFTADNLALARRRIREPLQSPEDIFFVRWWKNFYGLLSLNGWALLALASFLAGMLLLSVRLLKPSLPVARTWRIALFSVSALALLMTAVRWWQHTYRYRGILIGERIEFRSREGKEESAKLSEGIEVVFLGRGKSGLQVRLPDGRIGEIPTLCFKRL
jgi:hypothetical protein